MTLSGFAASPARTTYDVIIAGGAMMGSAAAWWLRHLGFGGTILVLERDPTYEWCSTAHTNSCIRQQFSNEINIRISQFGAEFINRFRDYMGEGAPDIPIQSYGYLYLSDNAAFTETLRKNRRLQTALGAGTRIMTPAEIAAEWPFYDVEDLHAGSHNPLNEGYFDGGTIFDYYRRKARQAGVEYVAAELTGIEIDKSEVASVTLADGTRLSCGIFLNATGPRAARTAAMAGIALPVEPRKRYTYIFEAETPLEKDLPLTIDPSGVHMRSDGAYYLAGCPPDVDPAVAPTDFVEDHSLWEEKVWPVLAARVPAFERIRLRRSWVGHYAFNTLDQNAILGPHPEITNFHFINGFSGHGLQQSAAMGRGAAELILHGCYRTLDLSPFSYARILDGRPFLERAVI